MRKTYQWLLGLSIACSLAVLPAVAQDRAGAMRLLANGRTVDAVTEGRRLAEAAPADKRQEAWRFAAWLCLAASDFECAHQVLEPFDAWLKTQPAAQIAPATQGYELALWAFRQTALGDILSVANAAGTAFPKGAADPLAEPVLFAELSLNAAARARWLQEFETARDQVDRALASVLTLEGEAASFDAARLIVRIVVQMLVNYDTERALRLFAAAEPILQRIPPASFLQCEYLQARAFIAGHARNHAKVAQDLRQLLACLDKVQIKLWLSAFLKAATYNDLLGVETLRGDPKAIREVLQAHPIFLAKQAILARGHFADRNEFMFGLAEELAQLALGNAEPTGWQPLLAQPPRWPADFERLREVAAFGEAARGLHLLRTAKTAEARNVLVGAAKARLRHLQDFHRQSRHASPLIYWTEQALLEHALAAAFAQGEPDHELVLGANLQLTRSLRSAPDDALAMQAVQDSVERRRVAQALTTAGYRRNDWEKTALAALAKRLQAPAPAERPVTWAAAEGYLTELQRLRTALVSEGAPGVDTVATLAAVRDVLAANEALVFYVPALGKLGRICVRADRIVSSLGTVDDKAIALDARLLRAALTAGHAASDEADSQYPAAAAVRLQRHLFDGLDDCLKASPRVYLLLPEGPLDGLPPAALLREEPPRWEKGYDLREARWLVRDHAFVRTTSIGAFVAAKRLASTRRATLDYLGIGDPVLAERAAQGVTGGQYAARGSLATTAGNLRTLEELPEASEEIAAVAGLFEPARSRLLRRAAASEKSFRHQPLSEFDVLHFATHGLVREELAGLTEPSLVLTPAQDGDPLDDGLLTASQIAALPLRARLAILSACNTARYDARVIDDGIQGLAAAFAIAGVPTLIASLWPIDSLIAKTLVADTVRLARGSDKAAAADALALAMRQHLANEKSRALLHPRFWAALVVLGDGSVTIGAGEKQETRDLAAFAALDPETKGGLLSMAGLGADFIVATGAAVQRRAADGQIKWQSNGSATRVAVAGEAIYAAGEALSRLDAGGKTLWSIDLAKDGKPLALLAVEQGAVVLFEKAVVRIGADGKEIARRPLAATSGFLGRREGELLVAANLAAGNPCADGGIELEVLGLADLKPLRHRRIERLQVHDGMAGPRGWLLAGATRGCSEQRAAAYFLGHDSSVRPVWQDESPYPTSARALGRKGRGFEIVSHAERAAGELVSITLGADGYEERRDSIGAGVDVAPQGIATSSAATILYGRVGSGALWLAR